MGVDDTGLGLGAGNGKEWGVDDTGLGLGLGGGNGGGGITQGCGWEWGEGEDDTGLWLELQGGMGRLQRCVRETALTLAFSSISAASSSWRALVSAAMMSSSCLMISRRVLLSTCSPASSAAFSFTSSVCTQQRAVNQTHTSFSSPGSTFCADSYFGICSTPVLL